MTVRRPPTLPLDPPGQLFPGADRRDQSLAVDQGLRAAYRTVLEEPIPDRLLDLLGQLDAAHGGKG